MFNAKKENAENFARKISSILSSSHEVRIYNLENPFPDDLSESDLIVTAGGDGTTLKTVSFLANKTGVRKIPPFIAVNFGRKGYLMTCEAETFLKCFNRFFKNKHKVKKRYLAQAETDEAVYYFLNEISILRHVDGQVIEIQASAREEMMIKTRADGVVAATETGSTAYAYSAGGGIIVGCPEGLSLVFIASEDRLGPYFIGKEAQPLHLDVPSDKAALSLDGTLIKLSGPFSIRISVTDYTVDFVF